MATTNEHKQKLIGELKKHKELASIAKALSRPNRQSITVNLSKVDAETKTGDVVVVPGKVLGTGTLSSKITLAAWKFSDSAFEKIKTSGSKAMHISELVGKKLDKVKVMK